MSEKSPSSGPRTALSETRFDHGTDTLVIQLHSELRTIARREFFRAGAGQTLQATALISEAYLKLRKRTDWQSEGHFLGCAATAIRHILIDAARARLAAKRRPADVNPDELLDFITPPGSDDDEIVRLGDAVRQLHAIDPNLARLVDCRFFAGLSEQETAKVLGVTDRTVRRWWTQARALIHREMLVEE